MRTSEINSVTDLLGPTRSNAFRNAPFRFLLAALIVVVGGATAVLAQNLSPNNARDIPSTVGSASVTMCSNRPILTVIPGITNGVERVAEISVDNIPIECAGKTLVVEFRDENDNVLDRVVWRLELVNLTDTALSARANGTNVSSANTSASGISVNYPFIETGTNGLDTANVNPANIARFSIVASVSEVTE